jgi:SAM-dependent methyltransferase
LALQVPELELTGERTLPGIPEENYWFTRHVVTYRFCMEQSRGLSVVDVGCGEGYGSSMLAETAGEVLAIDIDPPVISHANARYRKANLTFEEMDVKHIDRPDDSFDMAVSLQVIEHIYDQSEYLSEVSRLLRSDGKAVISTPNRFTISPGSDRPVNPFHFREYAPGELKRLLGRYFEQVDIMGVFHSGWLGLVRRLQVIDFVNIYTMSRLDPRYWSHRLLTPRITEAQFRIGTEDLDRCLDIIAVCVGPREATGSREECDTVAPPEDFEG